MATTTDNETLNTKESVFEKVDVLCNKLKKSICVDQHDSTRADGNAKKQSKKTKPTKGFQHEMKSHFSGLSHELQLLADLFPCYKITEGMEDAAEMKKKDEELKKWVVLEHWVVTLAQDIDQIQSLTRQQEYESLTDSKQAAGLVSGTEKANEEIRKKLLEVIEKVAAMKEKIQQSHRKKPPLEHSNDPSDVGMIDMSLLESSMVSTNFQDRYQRLDNKVKLCFLCMAFFPENFVIKKQQLVYWWIGEGLIDFTEKETAAEVAEEVITKLVDSGLIETVPKMAGGETDGYTIQPVQRLALVQLANRINFFDFEGNGMPTAKVDSGSCKACLVDDAAIPPEKSSDYLLTYLAEGAEEPEDDKIDRKLRRLQALLNHDRRLVYLNFKRFSNMKNLNVLHLGRWRNASKDRIILEITDPLEAVTESEIRKLLEGYIEVEPTDFLKGLKYMKHLKYISFQGVSNIHKLPESVCKLPWLRVLDLRACRSLQKLPKDIGNLKLLTHLDISECYFLHGLPKSLSLLVKLQVLKGFVIGDHENKKHYCTLQNLKGFVNLKKLTIRTSNAKFPGKEEFEAFGNFKKLQKLSIAWVQSPHDLQELQGEDTGENSGVESRKKFPQLEKLDMLCFPRVESPYWLSPRNLGTMKKLQIRGGKMKKMMQGQQMPEVQKLILKYLRDFTQEWDQLRHTFPKLNYLEKVKCPSLEGYPCNEKGVWTRNPSSGRGPGAGLGS